LGRGREVVRDVGDGETYGILHPFVVGGDVVGGVGDQHEVGG
jgi:hypothetical protein